MVAVPEDYYAYARKRESGGSKDPYNSRSTASTAAGPYQFLDGTARSVAEQHPELGLGPNWRSDPQQAEIGMRAHTEDNARGLSAKGHPVTQDTLYLAHNFGLGGAMRAFSADPNASVSDIFPEVMAANKHLAGKRISDITGNSTGASANMATNSYEDAPVLGARAQIGEGVLAPEAYNGGLTQQQHWGNALIGVGSAISGIDNPEQAKALLALKRTAQGPADSFTVQVDPKTGRGLRINTKTGQVTTFQSHDPTPEKDPAAEAYRTDTAKGFSEKNRKIEESATSSQSALGSLDTLRAALTNPSVYQGTGGDSVAYMKKLAQGIGFDVNGVADADLASAMMNKLTQESRLLNGGMPGSLSDKDLAFLKAANPGLDKTPEGNQRILDIYQKLHTRNIEMNEMRREYTQGGKKQLDEGFNTFVSRKWAAEKAAADAADREADKAKPAPSTAAPKVALPKGVKSIQLIQ